VEAARGKVSKMKSSSLMPCKGRQRQQQPVGPRSCVGGLCEGRNGACARLPTHRPATGYPSVLCGASGSCPACSLRPEGPPHRHGAVKRGDLLARDVVPPHLRQPVADSLQPVSAEVVQADVGPAKAQLPGGRVGSRRLRGVQLCGAEGGGKLQVGWVPPATQPAVPAVASLQAADSHAGPSA
jgi:hypothetical protein